MKLLVECCCCGSFLGPYDDFHINYNHHKELYSIKINIIFLNNFHYYYLYFLLYYFYCIIIIFIFIVIIILIIIIIYN